MVSAPYMYTVTICVPTVCVTTVGMICKLDGLLAAISLNLSCSPTRPELHHIISNGVESNAEGSADKHRGHGHINSRKGILR